MDITEDDLLQAEREAVKLFLFSVVSEFNSEFTEFSAILDSSAGLPQIHVRENGKI